MPKLINTTLFFFFICSCLHTSAQKRETFIGGNLIYAFPSSAFKTGYKHGTGIEGSLGIGKSKVYLIGTVGYQSYKAISTNPYGKITVIPVKAGLRVYPVKSIFLTGNAGVGFLKDEVMSSRESRFMYDAGIGFHFFLPQISVHYEAWKKQSSPGYTTAVLLKMGFALK